MKGIIFPTERHETGVSDNTLFLTSEDQQKEPTLTTAKTLKDYMQGIIALGNPGFATGDDVYEVISQLQNSRSNYHYLGVSNEEVAQLVNRMTPIQKEAFNTEIFVVQRTNGTVVQYALLKGEGPFGAGKQQITMADLVDLSAGQSLTLDEAMSDSSNNSVKNRVIKAYVDMIIRNLEQTKVSKQDGKDLMPLAQAPNNTTRHFLNASGEYQEVSANNFTDELKEKLEGVETGAQVNVQSDYLETNTNAASFIKDKPDLTVLQPRTDNALITDNKQIVGAINELSSSKEDKGVAYGLIVAHNQNDSAHQDIRNSIDNIAGGSVVVQKSEFAEKLGNQVSSYTKTQLDHILDKLVKDMLLNETNYVLTVHYQDGTTKEIDFPIEATVKDGRFDIDANELVLVLVSGQEIRIPAAGLAKVYVGKEGTTTTTTINSAGEITVEVKQGSVTHAHLHAELVAEIEGHQTITGDTKDNITTFTEATERINIASGDKQSVLFGKIMKWFSSLKALAFKDKVNWDTDIENTPAIPDSAHLIIDNKQTQTITGIELNINTDAANASKIGFLREDAPIGFVGLSNVFDESGDKDDLCLYNNLNANKLIVGRDGKNYSVRPGGDKKEIATVDQIPVVSEKAPIELTVHIESLPTDSQYASVTFPGVDKEAIQDALIANYKLSSGGSLKLNLRLTVGADIVVRGSGWFTCTEATDSIVFYGEVFLCVDVPMLRVLSSIYFTRNSDGTFTSSPDDWAGMAQINDYCRVVVTPTLASSYPDGTIVIKTA